MILTLCSFLILADDTLVNQTPMNDTETFVKEFIRENDLFLIEKLTSHHLSTQQKEVLRKKILKTREDNLNKLINLKKTTEILLKEDDYNEQAKNATIGGILGSVTSVLAIIGLSCINPNLDSYIEPYANKIIIGGFVSGGIFGMFTKTKKDKNFDVLKQEYINSTKKYQLATHLSEMIEYTIFLQELEQYFQYKNTIKQTKKELSSFFDKISPH